MRFTIIQVKILKEDLEVLEINKLNNTLFLLDIEAIYRSIKYKLVEKAVICFEKKLKFGMNSTLMSFQEKYYKYSRCMEMQDNALTIGGCGSAWLENLVAAYVIENTQQHFF